MSQTRTGHCMCGRVRFVARNVPQVFGACHCDMCKRWSGNMFNGVSVVSGDLDLTGQDHIRRVQTSEWAERANCESCGSPLWYRVTDPEFEPKTHNMALGLFDDTSGMTLGHEFFVDRKTSANDLPKDRKQFTEAETLALFAPEDASHDQGDKQ
ncbi:GFA family protein [Rhodobacteraceae bacterium M382]|nr:GFA family protein [Rhodobacteraceae bacterium M382]